MNDQIVTLIKDKIDGVSDDVKSLEGKVDELIRWKYYFTGVAAVVGAFAGLVMSIVVAILGRGR